MSRLVYFILARGSHCNYWHSPFPSENERLIHPLAISLFKVFPVGAQSFFRPFEPRPEERKELKLWKEPDQHDSFSDSSYLFPIQRVLQNQVITARTEANSILPRSWVIQQRISCYWFCTSGTFLVGLLLHPMMQSLIAWFNECSWHLLWTIAQSPCLDTADLLLLFFYHFSLPSSLCYEQRLLFLPVSKTPRYQ